MPKPKKHPTPTTCHNHPANAERLLRELFEFCRSHITHTKEIQTTAERSLHEALIEADAVLDGEEWREIGAAGVDAGMLMIGDPCYFFGPTCEAQEKYKDWTEALRDFYASGFRHSGEGDDFVQLRYVRGHSGLGVVVDVDGDGTYPVMGRFEKGHLVEIKISLRD